MTMLPKGALTLAAAALLLWAPPSLALAPHAVAFAPGGTISINGDSTLHKYACTSTAWHINAAATGATLATSKLASLEVVVPVSSLKSGDGALDANLVKALEGAKYPNIRFLATRFDSRALSGGKYNVTAIGRLTIAGQDHAATVHATAGETAKTLHVVGGYNLAMSTFGVTPPVLLGGMIKVADPIAVSFDLTATLPD